MVTNWDTTVKYDKLLNPCVQHEPQNMTSRSILNLMYIKLNILCNSLHDNLIQLNYCIRLNQKSLSSNFKFISTLFMPVYHRFAAFINKLFKRHLHQKNDNWLIRINWLIGRFAEMSVYL